jgi:16S rRNA U516 pseudouridylate synthase RsuA-like enzyme
MRKIALATGSGSADVHVDVHILLHKPIGCVSSRVDNAPPAKRSAKRRRVGAERAPIRDTVYKLIEASGYSTDRLGMVGRLDADTSGALLFTTSAAINRAVSRPAPRIADDNASFAAELKTKSYVVAVFGNTRSDMVGGRSKFDASARLLEVKALMEDGQRDADGSTQSGGGELTARAPPSSLPPQFLNASALEAELREPLTFARGGFEQTTRPPLRVRVERCWLEEYQRRDPRGAFSAAIEIDLQEGKHRQIRRLVHRCALKVRRLHRRRVAGILTCDGLAAGEARALTADEVATLQRGCRELEEFRAQEHRGAGGGRAPARGAVAPTIAVA